jgi:hypothetical protein
LLELRMPWPPKELNPNGRLTWKARSKIVRGYRTACAVVVKDAAVPGLPPGLFLLDLTFHPPDRRSRDRDNMLSAFKAGIDGMAMGVRGSDGEPVYGLTGLGIDDHCFDEITFRAREPVPGGAVVARVRSLAALSPVGAAGGSLLD